MCGTSQRIAWKMTATILSHQKWACKQHPFRGKLSQPMVVATHKEFALRLNEALDLQGLRRGRGRRVKIAKMGGVSGEGARKWLSGESLPTMEHAIVLASECGVCVEWLLTGRGPKSLSETIAPPKQKLPDDMMRLIRALESLSPESRSLLHEALPPLPTEWRKAIERRYTAERRKAG